MADLNEADLREKARAILGNALLCMGLCGAAYDVQHREAEHYDAGVAAIADALARAFAAGRAAGREEAAKDGWVLVPIEPTMEMRMDAWIAVYAVHGATDEEAPVLALGRISDEKQTAQDLAGWRAALAAAPTPPLSKREGAEQ